MASEIPTAPGESDDTSPQRGATRAPVRKPVRLQFDDAIDVVEARCHNVSIGGMFVHSKEGRQVGSLVRFELLLDEDSSIRGLAEVVWMRSQDHGPERVAGMGLRFRFLEQRDRQLIFKLVSQHIKERLAARHPGLGDDESAVDDEPDAPPPIRAPASTVERVTKPAEQPKPSPVRSGEALPSIDEFEEPAMPAAAKAPTTPPVEPDPARTPYPLAAAPAAAEETEAAALEDDSGQRSLLFRTDESDEAEAAEPQVDEYDSGPVAVTETSSETTGAWLQQGLADGGSFESRAGFGDGEPDAPAYAEYEEFDSGPSGSDHGDGYSEDSGYDTELYGDDSHFEHRPKPRRDIPILTLAAVLVTALAVSAYLWGDKLFDRGAGDDVSPSPLAGASLADDPVAVDEAPPSGAGSGETGAADTAPGESREPAATDEPATGTPATVSPATETPATVTPPPARTQAPAASNARPFGAVRDISARVAGSEVEIVITTDGRVDTGRYSHSRLPEGAPRELIRLRGLTTRFTTEKIPVGIGAVRQVRTGWHRKSSGNELHVVIDLANRSAQVTGIRVEGNQIIASITG